MTKYKIEKLKIIADDRFIKGPVGLILFLICVVIAAMLFFEVTDRIVELKPVPAAKEVFGIMTAPEQSPDWAEKKARFEKLKKLGVDDREALGIAACVVDLAHGNEDLVLAIIKTESNFNAMAKSDTDDHGLAQINWYWWGRELKEAGIVESVRDLYIPEKNVEACMYVLEKINFDMNRYNTKPQYPGWVYGNLEKMRTL